MRTTRLTRGLSFAAGFGAVCLAFTATPAAAQGRACDGVLPVSGEFSSGFGHRGRGFHPGVDIRAPYGSPVSAARAGRVVFAGRYYAYGLIVDIEHTDGTVARYAHLSRIAPGVSVGAQIGPNGSIGAVGRTGRTTGSHLHIELRIDGRPVNPWPWLTQTACLEDQQLAEAPR